MRIARSSQIRARTMSISSAAQTSGSVRGMKHQAPAGVAPGKALAKGLGADLEHGVGFVHWYLL